MPEGAATSARDVTPHVLLSSSELIKYRDERKTLAFTLVNGQVLEGVIRWFDSEAIHIATGDRDELTLVRHSLLYYSAK